MVYPKYPDSFWSFSHILWFKGKKASFPPLGLLTVASMLPRDWEIKLVDLNVEVLTNATILWADMVFISAMIVQENSAMEVVARAKALGKIVVVGGPLFTSHPEKFEIIDHLVLNEAEVTLPSFLTDLENSNPQHIYSDWTKPAITQTQSQCGR